MLRLGSVFAICVVAGALNGCRSYQLASDQDHIRAAVLDLQTNQLVDNLIRIRRGLPILQLDYVHMTGTVNQAVNGTIGGSQTTTDTTNTKFATTLVPGFAAFTHAFSNILNYSGGASQTNQLTLTAEPITNDPEVYNRYLEFLKQDDTRLLETCDPPPPGHAVVVRCFDEPVCDGGFFHFWGPRTRRVYFWVPVQHKAAFFKLALYAVALRGSPVQVSPFFEVTITGFTGGFELVEGTEDSYQVNVKIDKKIPIDRGFMIAAVKGHVFEKKKSFEVAPVEKSGSESGNLAAVEDQSAKSDEQTMLDEVQPITDSKMMEEVLVTFVLRDLNRDAPGFNITLDDVRKDLLNQKVRIRLDNAIPGGSKTDTLLEDIRHQLELQRLNQFQFSTIR